MNKHKPILTRCWLGGGGGGGERIILWLLQIHDSP